MIYILMVWLAFGAGNAPPVIVDRYGTLAACEQAGAVWDATQKGDPHHHVCLPYR